MFILLVRFCKVLSNTLVDRPFTDGCMAFTIFYFSDEDAQKVIVKCNCIVSINSHNIATYMAGYVPKCGKQDDIECARCFMTLHNTHDYT